LREDAFVPLVEVGEPVIDVKLAAAVGEGGEIFVQSLAIGLADHGRVGDQVGAVFHVHKAHGPGEIEVEFLAVKQVKDGHVVFIKAEMLEAFEQFGDLGEKVADDDNQTPLAGALAYLSLVR